MPQARSAVTSRSPRLWLYLLGTFRLEREISISAPARPRFKPLRLPTQKIESLLAYLVLYPEPHPRDQLATLFWDEASNEGARSSLRRALAILRQAIGQDIILTDRATVQFNPAFPLWLDVSEFRSQAETFLRIKDPNRPINLDLYQSDLLHDLPDEWIKPRREELRSLYVQVLQVLGHHHRARANSTASIGHVTNLRAPLTSFIGREQELTELMALLQTTRLLTLTGAGGCGKTRLAIQLGAQVIDQFEQGVWWVDLAGLRDDTLVPEAIVQSLGLDPSPRKAPLDSLTLFLQTRQLLLILDNCEHLLDACARTAESLLTRCPDLRILATSRQAFNTAGEREWIVPSLSLSAASSGGLQRVDSGTLAAFANTEAVRLFAERARAVRAEFELTPENIQAVVQICERLDGIPLAIELAAARIKLLTPEHLAVRLHDRFSLLTTGSRSALPRHQTLRACIDWSYDLMPAAPQKLFRRLAVFPGGFSLEAAETVCADEELPSRAILDHLARLVDRSLVKVEQHDGRERYRLLETIREYAHARLVESGEWAMMCNNHLAFFLKMAQAGEPNASGIEQPGWLEQMEVEHDNLRAALEWGEESYAVEAGLALATALLRFWRIHGPVKEGRAWLGKFLSATQAATQPPLRARALFAAANLAWWQSDLAAARPLYEKSLTLGRQLQDKRITGWALFALGALNLDEGYSELASSLCQEALVLLQQANDKWGAAETKTVLALLAWRRGDTAEALRLFQEEIVSEQEMGPGLGLANASCWLAYVELDAGATDHARILVEQALTIDRKMGARNYSIDRLEATAGVSNAQHDLARAARLLGASEHLREAMDYPRNTMAQEFYSRQLVTVRSQLDDSMIAQAWKEGQAMDLEQAVKYALDPAWPLVEEANPNHSGSSEAPDPESEPSLFPELHAYLLGGFHLEYDGEPVTTIESPRLQSLLAYLLLHRDAPQSRQHLAFLLYPDSTEKQARTNLRNLLHLLRDALPEPDRFLVADSQTLQWRSDVRFTLDVEQFEQAIGQAQTTAALGEAVALYRGDLVPGCYADWILSERERLQHTLIAALERLIQQLENGNEYRAAINYAERLLGYEPLREETYRLLMRLHGLCGDRAEVVRVFNSCVSVLESELGVEPSPETRQVFEQLLKAEPATDGSPLLHGALNNLPFPLTSFIGRQQEIAEIKSLLPTTRLLTLTGPGGIGKTRLALRVAGDLTNSFKEGVVWVEFAALSDPALVPQEVATALGVQQGQQRTPEEALRNFLRAKQILLVLDNCEHLLEACAQLAHNLLSACPHLSILATSRELFGVVGETVFQVPAMSVPLPAAASAEHLIEYESIALFVERARAVKPDFALTRQNALALAEVSQRLDGIPLAIELAAARTRLLKVENIAARLDDRFNLLTSGNRVALARHQTLRGAIDWSYDLLPAAAQMLFRRLSVFLGGFTLEAAETVCPDEELPSPAILNHLARLVDRSLILVEQHSGMERYRLLETIREYAHDRLVESGERITICDNHLAFFLHLAQQGEPNVSGIEQPGWLEHMEVEHDNLRAALNWAEESHAAETGLVLATALSRFWRIHGPINEGQGWLAKFLALGIALPGPRAKALYAAGELAWWQADLPEARRCAEEIIELRPQLEDTRIVGWALTGIGWIQYSQGQYDQARKFGAESIALMKQTNDRWGVREAVSLLATCAWRQGNTDEARRLLENEIASMQKDAAESGIAQFTLSLAYIELDAGDSPRAQDLLRQSLILGMKISARNYSLDKLEAVAGVAAAQLKPTRAARLLGASERLREVMGYPRNTLAQEFYSRHLRSVQSQLNDPMIDRAWREGQAMDLEEAVKYALDLIWPLVEQATPHHSGSNEATDQE